MLTFSKILDKIELTNQQKLIKEIHLNLNFNNPKWRLKMTVKEQVYEAMTQKPEATVADLVEKIQAHRDTIRKARTAWLKEQAAKPVETAEAEAIRVVDETDAFIEELTAELGTDETPETAETAETEEVQETVEFPENWKDLTQSKRYWFMRKAEKRTCPVCGKEKRLMSFFDKEYIEDLGACKVCRKRAAKIAETQEIQEVVEDVILKFTENDGETAVA